MRSRTFCPAPFVVFSGLSFYLMLEIGRLIKLIVGKK